MEERRQSYREKEGEEEKEEPDSLLSLGAACLKRVENKAEMAAQLKS